MSLAKDLLEPIWSTLPLEGVDLELGPDNYDVLKFEANAVVKYPSRMVLPTKISDFWIAGTAQTATEHGGYVFTVMNPAENIIQLGVHVSDLADNGHRNISLYYTDLHQEEAPRESREAAVFQVPATEEYFRFAFKVLVDEVIFYHECEEKETASIRREPNDLEFDQASIVYIGQAGDKLKGNFEVSDTVLGLPHSIDLLTL